MMADTAGVLNSMEAGAGCGGLALCEAGREAAAWNTTGTAVAAAAADNAARCSTVAGVEPTSH